MHDLQEDNKMSNWVCTVAFHPPAITFLIKSE